MNHVGIDIHKKYSVACVQDEAGKVIKRVRIEGNSEAPEELEELDNQIRFLVFAPIYDTDSSLSL